jgi:hypothetical protein
MECDFFSLQGRAWTQLFILKCWSIWGMLFGEKSWKMEKWLVLLPWCSLSQIPGSAAVLGEESHSLRSPSTVISRSHFLQLLTLPETQDWAKKSFCFSRRNSTVSDNRCHFHFKRCLPYALPAMAVLLVPVSLCKRAVHWWWLGYVTYVSSSLQSQEIFVGTAHVTVMEHNGMLQLKMEGDVYSFSEWSVLHIKWGCGLFQSLNIYMWLHISIYCSLNIEIYHHKHNVSETLIKY